jgi:hypothetical protein
LYSILYGRYKISYSGTELEELLRRLSMKKGVKTYVSLLLVLVLVFTFASPLVFAKGNDDKTKPHANGKAYSKIGFWDVDETIEWARLAIDRMSAKGILKGYEGGVFKPNSSVTHLEAIIMALRVMGWEEQTKQVKILPFEVKKIKLSWDAGYYYVAIAVEKGIIKPEELKGFNPNQSAKRYEVAKYIVRALGKEAEAKKHMDAKLPFKDREAIPKDAVGYVYVITEKLGLMQGYNNLFQPQKSISRAEMAVLMNRLDDVVDDDDDEKEGNRLTGTVENVDVDKRKITIKNEGGKKSYDVVKDAPVYINGKYRGLKDLRQGDMVELMLDSDGKVIFIQVVKPSEKVTATVKGLVTNVDYKKDKISVFTTDAYGKAFVGILKENDISGKHYELNTEHERFVLVGETDGLEDYLDEKIVVIGKVKNEPNIYMRGELIQVEKIYPVNAKNTVQLDVDDETTIIIDGKNEDIDDIDPGDFATIKAVDGLATKIEVKSYEYQKREREREREEEEQSEETKIEGKIVSLTLVGSQWKIQIENSDGKFTYRISNDVELDGVDNLAELKVGFEVELGIKDNKVIEIEIID